LTKIIIKEENFKWHLEAFASELFIYIFMSFFYHLKYYIALFHNDLQEAYDDALP